MVTLVLASHKGGVGRTTSVLNIGDELAARGYSVLLIDGDQRGNLSQSSAPGTPADGTLTAVLRGELTVAGAMRPVRENLYLLPAGSELNDAVVGRAKQPGAELALRKLLAPLQVDYVLIDTPGSLGKFTDMALAAATAVFIPLHPDNYGLSGLVTLILRCRLMEENVNPGLRVAGLFLTQYHPNDRRVILRKNIDDMRANDVLEPMLMRGTIRDNVAVKEAQSMCVSFQDYLPDCAAAVDYRLLTEELLARLNHAKISKKDLLESVPLDEQRLVAFSVRLHFDTFLRLKQALHHLGIPEQDFMEETLNRILDELPESRLPLPARKMAQLLKKAGTGQ